MLNVGKATILSSLLNTSSGCQSSMPEAIRHLQVRSRTRDYAKIVYLSLGSNLGDRVAKIRRALKELTNAGVEVLRVSSLYKTEPVDFRPQAWFVNCVAEARTGLMPAQLLKAVQGIERALGRRRGILKGPRPIDIDILLYENVVLRSSVLTIPHARMSERRFVLVPLRELGGELRHPVSRRTVLEMLHETSDTSQVVRLKDEPSSGKSAQV